MKTPDNSSIDFKAVTLEEAGETESSAAYAARMASRDNMYRASPSAKPTNPGDRARRGELLAKLFSDEPNSPMNPGENPGEKQEVGVRGGSTDHSTDYKKPFNNQSRPRIVSEGRNPSNLALDIYSHTPSTGLKATTGALATATPLLGFLMASVAAPPAAFALPVVAAGIAVYGAYRMFKTWREKRAFKKNFGLSVDEQLGHD